MPNSNRPPAKTPLHDSTVAVTMYNIACIAGQPCTLNELFAVAKKRMHLELELEQAQRALDGLIQRGLVELDEDKIALRDALRRPVVARESSGAEAAKGVLQGGWSAWRVQDRAGTKIPIEEAIEGGPKPIRAHDPQPLRAHDFKDSKES